MATAGTAVTGPAEVVRRNDARVLDLLLVVRARGRQRAAQPPSRPTPPPPSPPPAAVAPPASPAAEPTDVVSALSRPAHLRDSGALTEAEFQAAKARIPA